MLLEHAREDVVAAPPAEEESSEEQSGAEAAVDASDAVRLVDLGKAVDGALVQAVGLGSCVLDLQPGLDVLHGRGDEANGASGHDTRKAVSVGREVNRGVGGLPARLRIRHHRRLVAVEEGIG